MNILPIERQTAVVSALVEGCSIRTTERLTQTHRDTVMRLGVKIGRGCAALHDLMFRDLQVSQLQFDELWAFIGKKQKRLKKDDDASKGDNYTFVALDALNKAIVASGAESVTAMRRSHLSKTCAPAFSERPSSPQTLSPPTSRRSVTSSATSVTMGRSSNPT